MTKLNRFIPDNSTEVQDTESSAVVYTYMKGDYFCAIAYAGRRRKPDWHYRYHTAEQRQEAIDKHFKNMQEKEAIRKKEAEERKAFKHSFKVGDFLYSSWGYDQTNIDFYQVVAVPSDKSIRIQEVAQKVVKSATACDYVAPVKDKFIGEPKLKRVGKYGVYLTSYANAYAWGGEPKYQTATGCGH